MSNDHTTLFQVLNLVATIPSLIGTLLMSYFCFKNRSANILVNLILALAICDFMYSASNLMSVFGSELESAACVIEAFSREFFSKLSVCLVTSIAILHYKILESAPGFNKNKFLLQAIAADILLSSANSLRYVLSFFPSTSLSYHIVQYMQRRLLQSRK